MYCRCWLASDGKSTMDRLRQARSGPVLSVLSGGRSQPLRSAGFFARCRAFAFAIGPWPRSGGRRCLEMAGLAAIAVQCTDGTGEQESAPFRGTMFIELFIATACLFWIVGSSIKSVVAVPALRVQGGEKNNRVNLNVKRYGDGPVFNDTLLKVCNRQGSAHLKILITGNMGYVGPEVAKHLRVRRSSATLDGDR